MFNITDKLTLNLIQPKKISYHKKQEKKANVNLIHLFLTNKSN